MIFSNDCYVYDRCKKFKDGRCKMENDFCIKLFKLDYLYNESNLSLYQRNYTPLRVDADGTDKDKFLELKGIEDNIEDFVRRGENLYLHSRNCGNGKTEWAIRMIQGYLASVWHKCDLGCKALFINVPRLLISLKDNITEVNPYAEHIKKNFINADVVVWDEIGTKTATQFEHENLLNMINTRIDNGKSNIYTSNLSPEELKDRLGDRLYSRIVNLSTDIELFGADKRGAIN